MGRLVVASIAEVNSYESQARDALAQAEEIVRQFSAHGPDLMRVLRFRQIAPHPTDLTRQLTMNECLLQVFTSLVVYAGARYIFENVSGITRLILRPGATSGGPDIVDENGVIAVAECFTGDPKRRVPHKKMTKIAADIQGVLKFPARHRFVFFFDPNIGPGRQEHLEVDGVTVMSVAI